MRAVQCASCGGAVAAEPGAMAPACLFCGSTALEARPEGVGEIPTEAVPFTVDASRAQAVFRAFARSSFWYPAAIRAARLELVALWVPAWCWSGEVETHVAGLVSAATRSGKAPRTTWGRARFDQVLVPASSGLTQAEVDGLGPFPEAALRAWAPGDDDRPHEVAQRTREAARAAGMDAMIQRHGAALAEGMVSWNAAGRCDDLDGRLVALPVWIGVYRFRDVPWRVVVHGHTGALVGEAPYDRVKIAAAAVLGLAALTAIGLGLVALAGG